MSLAAGIIALLGTLAAIALWYVKRQPERTRADRLQSALDLVAREIATGNEHDANRRLRDWLQRAALPDNPGRPGSPPSPTRNPV